MLEGGRGQLSIRVFCTADLHLGMKFGAYPDVQGDLAEARFAALHRLVDAANERQCDLFLVAGDMFESIRTDRKSVRRAAGILGEFHGSLVAVLPGNHDFHSGRDSSLWREFSSALVSGLVLDSSRPYPLNHYDLDAVLYPGPCTAKHSSSNAISWIPDAVEPGDGRVRIGIAHGSIRGVSLDEDGRYYPMTPEELDRCGMNLWVIGHTHAEVSDGICGSTPVIVPGTPEPDGFDCRHGGSAWTAEFGDDGRIRTERIETGGYRFLREEIAVESREDLDRILEHHGNRERTLLSLVLSGSLFREEYRELERLRRELAERLFFVEIDDAGMRERITPEDVEREFTPGSFPYRLLRRMIERKDEEALQIAYELVREAKR